MQWYRTSAVALALWAIMLPTLGHAKKSGLPNVRWTAGAPGCSFERSQDGHYHWTMSDKDLEITLIVDSQELAQSRHRFYQVVGLYLIVNYKGPGKFEFPADLRLDFIRHHDVLEGYLDPQELQNQLQNDVDSKIFETERRIKKHPEKKEEETALLREYQKETAEFIEFLTTQYLGAATLNPGNPEVHGWVFFPTKNKWIGPWKEHEDFLLGIWMKDKVWQFPFSLPPSPGDLILRKPEDQPVRWYADEFLPKIVLQSVLMEIAPKPASAAMQPSMVMYCPVCAKEVTDPLTCGDCSAVICRRCGTPLESSDELAMG